MGEIANTPSPALPDAFEQVVGEQECRRTEQCERRTERRRQRHGHQQTRTPAAAVRVTASARWAASSPSPSSDARTPRASATAGITTRIARHSLAPAALRDEHADRDRSRRSHSVRAEITKTEATMIAGSLANPASASFGVRMPVNASASSVSIPATSMRTRSLMNSGERAREDHKKDDLLCFHAAASLPAVRAEGARMICQLSAAARAARTRGNTLSRAASTAGRSNRDNPGRLARRIIGIARRQSRAGRRHQPIGCATARAPHVNQRWTDAIARIGVERFFYVGSRKSALRRARRLRRAIVRRPALATATRPGSVAEQRDSTAAPVRHDDLAHLFVDEPGQGLRALEHHRHSPAQIAVGFDERVRG